MSDTNLFGDCAYIICDDAKCFYQPDNKSAVRIIPPYGEMVSVVSVRDHWVEIRWETKSAWSPKAQLSVEAPKPRPKKFNIRDHMVYPIGTYCPDELISESTIEYGPRGGRYTRTKTGFRRYF